MDQMQGAAILLTGIFVGMAISQMDLGARSPKRDKKTGEPLVKVDDFDLDHNYIAVADVDFGPHPYI